MSPAELRAVLNAHKAWLLGEKDGKRAGLGGADLRGAFLRGADLRGADLSETDLRGAVLRAADLRGADLRDTALSDADLHGADLRATGCLRVQGTYGEEATLYPGFSGPELEYGCERRPLAEWEDPDTLRELCEKHEPGEVDHYMAEITALCAMCRMVPQPVFEGGGEAVSAALEDEREAH